jgi:hypothetical protein
MKKYFCVKKKENGQIDLSKPGPSVSRPETDAYHDYSFSGYHQIHSVGIIFIQSLHYIDAANIQPGEAPVVHTCVCMYRLTNDFTSLFHAVSTRQDRRPTSASQSSATTGPATCKDQ